jgi:hypothetical protein
LKFGYAHANGRRMFGWGDIMKFQRLASVSLAAALVACGNNSPLPSETAATDDAELIEAMPPPPLPDNPHPAELATHCLRVLGSVTDGAHVERCKSEGLWAVASDRTGPVSEGCMLPRLVHTATSAAKEAGIIPRGSAWLAHTILTLDHCNKASQFVRLTPYPFTDRGAAGNEVALISFALRAIGEDRKWSPIPILSGADTASLCQAFEVATDEALRQQAKQALGCYNW